MASVFRAMLGKKSSSELLDIICSVPDNFIEDIERLEKDEQSSSISVAHDIVERVGYTLGNSMKVVWSYRILKERGEI